MDGLDVSGGNTKTPEPVVETVVKRQSGRIKWFFTHNNYSDEDISSLNLFLDRYAKQWCWQEEVGEQGTPHLQGCFWLKKAMRFQEFGLSDKIHWENIKGKDEDAIKYCSKEESKKPNTTVRNFGCKIPKEIRVITKLYPWQQEIADMCSEEADDRTINWFWEDEGNCGKSAFTKYMVVKKGACFVNGGAEKDIMNLIFNTDMDSCEVVIFDIPRAKLGHVSYSSLENIKNGLVCNTKYETGFKAFNPPHVCVFANAPPDDEEKLSKDRWNIKYIGKEKADVKIEYEEVEW